MGRPTLSSRNAADHVFTRSVSSLRHRWSRRPASATPNLLVQTPLGLPLERGPALVPLGCVFRPAHGFRRPAGLGRIRQGLMLSQRQQCWPLGALMVGLAGRSSPIVLRAGAFDQPGRRLVGGLLMASDGDAGLSGARCAGAGVLCLVMA